VCVVLRGSTAQPLAVASLEQRARMLGILPVLGIAWFGLWEAVTGIMKREYLSLVWG